MRSHLDGVRAVKFHPTEPLVLSGSEDQLVKVLLKLFFSKFSKCQKGVELIETHVRKENGPTRCGADHELQVYLKNLNLEL